MFNGKVRMLCFKLKKPKSGVVIIEAAFVLPLFFLLMFGILEAYRMKVAERLVDTVAMNAVTDVASSATVSKKRLENIIKTCHGEMGISLFPISKLDANVRCGIEVYKNHETAKASSIPVNWPIAQGNVKYYDGATGLKRGYTVAVTAFIKYEFLTELTKSAYIGRFNNNPFYIRKRHFMKCT